MSLLQLSIFALLFPAYAGVILHSCPPMVTPVSFPRVCGGDPYVSACALLSRDFSPRMRG